MHANTCLHDGVQQCNRYGLELHLHEPLVPGCGKVPPVCDPLPKEGVIWGQNLGHTSCILSAAQLGHACLIWLGGNHWVSVNE